MTHRRGTAAALALLLAALAAAGCGLGRGGGVPDVELTVTRDYGTVPVLHRQVGEVTASDTVMRVLERNADITTRYGGGFVQSIDGLEGSGGGGNDWFFYVNGLWSPVGAADYPLDGGESIWWDYRDWTVGERVAAAVGAWPQPFVDGYEGARHPTAVICRGGAGACAEVTRRLRDAGATLVAGDADDAIRVLVGPWDRLHGDQDAELVDQGVRVSGVFAEFGARGRVLRGLDESGAAVRRFGHDTGLVAATRREDDPPTWFVTGTSEAGVAAAVDLLDAKSMRNHYAVAVEGGEETALPIR
jgi:Domain of unknown function (DUF4430)